MKKITLFRTIALLIVLFNVLNYFFMDASYTGFNVKESATLFDYTFINFENIEGRWHVIGAASDNAFLPVLIVLFIDLYLFFVLLFNTKKTGDYLSMPYKRIFITCGLGILVHVLLFNFSVASSSHDEAYITMIWKGMLLNSLWIVGYITIIVFFHKIWKHKLTANDSYTTKLTITDVLVLGFLVELVSSFFYCSLVNRLVISGVSERTGLKYTRHYGKLFFSSFMMMFKQKNYYVVDGVVESYPYMIICLLVLISQVLLVIFKPKAKKAIVASLSLISVVIMTIGLADMCNSIYANYINENSRNFFSLVGPGYYFVILLNIAMISIYLYPRVNDECIIIDANIIEEIVNAEAKKKEENEAKEVVDSKEENDSELIPQAV